MEELARETFQKKGYLATIFFLLMNGQVLSYAEAIANKLRLEKIREMEEVGHLDAVVV